MAAIQPDPAWASHLGSDTFWILGIILVINWIWVIHQVDWSPFPKTTSENGHAMQDIEAREPASNEPTSQVNPSTTTNSDPEPQPEASPDLHSPALNTSYVFLQAYNPSPTPNSDPERQPEASLFLRPYITSRPRQIAAVVSVWAGLLIAGFFMVLHQVLFVIALFKLRPGVGDGMTEGGSRGSVGGVGSGLDPDTEQK